MLPEFDRKQLDRLYARWCCVDAERAVFAASEQLSCSPGADFAEAFAVDESGLRVVATAVEAGVAGQASSLLGRFAADAAGLTMLLALPVAIEGDRSAVVIGEPRPIDHGLPVSERKNAARPMSNLSDMQSLFEEISQANDELRAALESARAEMEAATHANAAKSAFLANMSHEIRTPMNAVVGFCDLLSSSELSDEQSEYVDAINHSGHMLVKVIGQVLDFSKIEAGKLELEDEPFALDQVLLEVEAMMSLQAKQAGLFFKVERYGQPWPKLGGDATRLKQILVNVLGNALRCTREGAVTLQVRSDAATSHERARFQFRVEDSGCGIAAERLDSIFEPFAQAERSDACDDGSAGLGLAICKRLCRAMDGDIRVERSSPGEGTVFAFEVCFDVLRDLVPQPETQPNPANLHMNPKSGIKQRLLVVDDNPNNQLITSKLSQFLGYETKVVVDGSEALKALAEETFAAVLMDVRMSPMDGFEATRRIRAGEAGEAARDIRIIAVTAHALKGDEDECRSHGMDDYLAKPLTLDRLSQCLGQIHAR